MQIHIFTNTAKRVGPSQEFISLGKYYNKYYTLDILCIFPYKNPV